MDDFEKTDLKIPDKKSKNWGISQVTQNDKTA